MNTREQFGDYLLLKKLSEDPLGESFRAGRLTPQGMDQVVLLRVFNGPGIDPGRLWQAISDRGEVHQTLSSPNIGAGVDLGQVRNVPYVAYDYVSGKDLASLLEQAVKRRHPVPSDHALLVAERVALALAVGYESRVGQERVLHGALVPHLVMISNEGETRVLGFEAAPGLRQVLASGNHPLQRYLSPEARAGEPIHKADDVFSLGAILLELLTGRPLPEDENAVAQAIDGAELQPDGSPLPAELKQLLLQSLTARSQRIADTISWHKTVSKLMFEGQLSPTTFNLAFYMHNLFRDDIERESQEIEVERTMEIPVATLTGAEPGGAAPATGVTPGEQAGAPDLREITGVREDTGVIRDRYGIDSRASASRKKMMLMGGAVAAVLLLGIGIVSFFLLRPSESAPSVDRQVAAAVPSSEVDEARMAAAAAAAAEDQQRLLEEQVRELIEQRLEERSREHEAELERIQAELEAQRRRVAEAQEAQRTAQAQVAEARTVETAPPPRETPRPESERRAEVEPASLPPGAEATRPESSPPTPAPAQEAAPTAQGDQVASLQPEPASTAEAAPPAAPAPAPERTTRYRPGDLVETGTPGLIPPRRIDMRQPSYPPQARRLGREGTVVVRVLVNERGEVIEAELGGEEAGFGMDHAALSAARTARYHAGTVEGVPVKVWVTMTFPFRL